jgi:thiol:disulfide interchange protein
MSITFILFWLMQTGTHPVVVNTDFIALSTCQKSGRKFKKLTAHISTMQTTVTQTTSPVQTTVMQTTSQPREQKDMFVAYLLWFFLGGLGIHRFYL